MWYHHFSQGEQRLDLNPGLTVDGLVALTGNLGMRNCRDIRDIGYRGRDTFGIEALRHRTCNSSHCQR